MKKIFCLVVGVVMMIGTMALANGSKPEPMRPRPAVSLAPDNDLEISGNIFAGAGWERFKTTTNAPTLVPQDINGTLTGTIGEYADTTNGSITRGNKEDVFKFFVDAFEVDFAKSFGENIRVRADLDFGSETMHSGPRFTNGSGTFDGIGMVVEQAYATANMPAGRGLELMFGRFNAPIGFELNDVVNNSTISRSIIYRALRPHTFTGVKLYYSFNDNVDWHLYIVNSGLIYDDGDVINTNTDVPGGGMRLGFHWGEEGKRSHLAFNGAIGQDHPTVASGMKRHVSFLGDMDFNWWATDRFAIGGEGIYRQIDSSTPGRINGKYVGGLLNLLFAFSDLWEGTIRYSYGWDINGLSGDAMTSLATGAAQSLTGATTGGQEFHEGVLALNYQISDGGRFRLEGDYTYINPYNPSNNQHVFGAGGGFAYEF